jgi:hypothetical protein
MGTQKSGGGGALTSAFPVDSRRFSSSSSSSSPPDLPQTACVLPSESNPLRGGQAGRVLRPALYTRRRRRRRMNE